MKTCKDCIHFRPYRDHDTKRIHQSKKGECGWQHGIEHWPLSIVRCGVVPWLSRVGVWDTTDATECRCFHWKPGAEPNEGVQLEIGGV